MEAIMFSHQNDTGSCAHYSQYWENLILMVILILDSEGLKSEITATRTLTCPAAIPQAPAAPLMTIAWLEPELMCAFSLMPM